MKHYFFTFLFCILCINSYSQTYSFAFADDVQGVNDSTLIPYATCTIDIIRQNDGKYTFQLTDLNLIFEGETEPHYFGTLILSDLMDMKFSDDYITLVAERDSASYSPNLVTNVPGIGLNLYHHLSLLVQFNEDYINFRVIGDYSDYVGEEFYAELSCNTFPTYKRGDLNQDGFVNISEVNYIV